MSPSFLVKILLLHLRVRQPPAQIIADDASRTAKGILTRNDGDINQIR